MADASEMVFHSHFHQREVIKMPYCPTCDADMRYDVDSSLYYCPIGHQMPLPLWRDSGPSPEVCKRCKAQMVGI